MRMSGEDGCTVVEEKEGEGREEGVEGKEGFISSYRYCGLNEAACCKPLRNPEGPY